MSKYAGTEDPINLEPINDYKGGASSEGSPVTPPEFELGPNLQSLLGIYNFFSSTPRHLVKQAKLPRPFVNVSQKTSFKPTGGPCDNVENDAPQEILVLENPSA